MLNTEDILSRQISGFHQYRLDGPVHLTYVSLNLCDMTGYAENELLDENRDLYAQLVHPADREQYAGFITELAKGAQNLAAEYRLVKKDGRVIWVRDTVSVRKEEDGTLAGDSVLTDISDLKKENSDLRFLNETIPCGFMKYTCEKQPKITYINQKMIDILRCPPVREGELDYLEMYKGNIFLMVPMEERRRFSKYLNRVYSADAPLAGEMALLRCDGTRAYVSGWVIKTVNEEGVEEFQSACMDITARHQMRKDAETRRYMKALTDVYDKIFEFNLDSNTVKCLHCEDSSSFKMFEDVPMFMEEALDRWILGAVEPESRDRIRGFFRDFSQKKLYEPDAKPPQITYTARCSTGEMRQYRGIFIKVDDSVSYYCCRHIQETGRENDLQTENDELKQKMKDLVMQFSDGIAAFEVSADGMVKPLYASDNVQEFFGYTEEEWLPLTEKYTPIETFVAYSEAAYEDFAELLRTGEAEYTYFDYGTETERKIKAICSPKEAGNSSPRYVMLYQVEDTETDRKKNLPENRTVTIRTFGYFDVFVGDKPIAFRNKKSKELLALLVDRRGGYVTSEEAIGFLWEDEPANTVTMSRYRKVALRLKNTLEEYGISDIVEAVDGKRRIVMEKVQCDLYQYCTGREEYAGLFRGSYLTNYSWGETTLGELSNKPE
ncbi:PAS domain-containing protein [Aristaeella lactis]|uniref:PAS domain S-box-containing protein n=1 Tax=Aristaeella lactis TaxID=3046383 RepID=A0AC61PJE4_9FIRM|nr:PAS domain-containing protein [Aristaeella lactis]QUA54123.1 PAS domain-containing protein [Aristaeella lactis]SMC44787.1 PAS domain S-box-containing protein [Aristaeella lactis]